MEDFFSGPVFWIILYAASEIIGESKLKENSTLRLVARLIQQAVPK